MTIRSLTAFVFALGFLAATAVSPARAGSFSYSTTRKEIKVGVLLVPNTDNDLENPDPYIFYIMDQRIDLKPTGWDFVNPLAPKAVTQYMRARRPAYTEGQPLTKNMAAYWEVPLTETSVDSLLQFDLLMIGNHRTMSLTPEAREKLRQLVDAGGQLWIDNCGETKFLGKAPFFLDLDFADGAGSGVVSVAVGAESHPLLNSPYQLTPSILSQLGEEGKIGGGCAVVSVSDNSHAPVDMIPVIMNGSLPYTAIAYYGSGVVLATAVDIGCRINDSVGSGGNSGPLCGTATENADASNLKFSYNAVASAYSSTTVARNLRRTGRSKEYLAPPLRKKWFKAITSRNYTPDTELFSQGPTPAIYKGVAFVSGIDNTLYALDCDPYSDLDRDGNPDDGEQSVDDPLDFRPDLVWAKRIDSAMRLSAPTVASVPTSNGGGIVDVVYVVANNSSGSQILAFNAFPRNGKSLATGAQLIASRDLPGINVPGGVAYLSPTSDIPCGNGGVLFAVGENSTGDGVVFRLSPLDLKNIEDPNGTEPSIDYTMRGCNFNSAPSIARMRDFATGATDLVLTATTRTSLNSSAVGQLNLFTYAVSDEPLSQDSANPNEYFTRFAPGAPASTSSGRQMRIAVVNLIPQLRLRFKYQNSNGAVTDASWSPSATGDVTVDPYVKKIPGKIGIKPNTTGCHVLAPVFADYALDTLPGSDSPQANFKPAAQMPFAGGSSTERPSGSGSVAIGGDEVCYFGTGYSQAGATSGGSIAAVQLQSRLRPTTRWRVALDSGTFAVGTPILADGVAYAAVTNGSASSILAFNTRKVFRYRSQNATLSGVSLRLESPVGVSQDVTRGGVTTPTPPAAFTVDYTNGEVTITDFGQCDATKPFAITDNNLANETFVLDGVSSDGSWNKITQTGFYTRRSLPGPIIDSPVMAGNILYALVRTAAGAELVGLTVNGLDFGEAVICPDTAGTLPGFDAGPAGAGGIVIVNGADGIYGYYSPVTLIADNSRLIEVRDAIAAGAPPNETSYAPAVWMCTNTYNVQGGKLVNPMPFREISMARRLDQTSMLVADTGNNRVVKMDRSGVVRWELTQFKDTYNLLNPGQTKPDPTNPLIAVSSIARPTDAIRWYDNYGANAHTIIVDSGNHRIISILSVWNAQNAEWEGNQLEWVTKSAVDDKQYDYRCVELLPPSKSSGFQIMCGITNVALDSNGEEQGEGSTLAVLSYTPATLTTGAAAARGVFRECYTLVTPGPRVPGAERRFLRVSSIERKVPDPIKQPNAEHILLTDGRMVVDTYRDLQGKLLSWDEPMDLPATCARRLSTGEILVVSGEQVGRIRGRSFEPLAGVIRVATPGLMGGAIQNDQPVRATFADGAF